METNIRDYITLHKMAYGIEFHEVECKSNICRIKFSELEQDAWLLINSGLMRQPWWEFNISSGSINTDRNGNSVAEYFFRKAERNISNLDA